MVRCSSLICALLVLVAAADADAARGRKKGAAKSKTGSLSVESSVANATVLVNGKAVGKTPLRSYSLNAGASTVVVKRAGFLDFTEKVQIAPGKTHKVFADLLPFAGVLKITADVPNAQVWVDGKNVGKAPLDYEVKLGSHEVRVTAAGKAPFVTTVTADPGNEYPINAKLAAGGGDAAAGDDLALAPLGGGGATAGDDLALAPLGGGGAAGGGGDDLALVPLGGGAAAGGDDLALAPLGGPATGGEVLELTAMTPPGGELGLAALPPGTGPGVGATAEPVKPWYMQWWAWTAAAAVVVTAVTVTAVVLSGGDDGPKTFVDCEFAARDRTVCFDTPQPAILQF